MSTRAHTDIHAYMCTHACEGTHNHDTAQADKKGLVTSISDLRARFDINTLTSKARQLI
jgi:hypothetical protein